MMNAGQPGFSNMVMQMRQQAMMQPMCGLPTAAAPIMPMSGISGMTMAGGPISNSIENVCRSIMASVSIFICDTCLPTQLDSMGKFPRNAVFQDILKGTIECIAFISELKK